MWINVAFHNELDETIWEYGHYDPITAVLDADSTKVYEAKLGVDATVSAASGVPEGESFHFALNNVRHKDNRIPPMGFTNVAFEAARAEPVAYTYADGQYWDDTSYLIPAGAVEAEVTVYYQSTSKEYVDFLLAQNMSDTTGQTLHDQWVATGMSAPAEMDHVDVALTLIRPGDTNGDGIVGIVDFLDVLAAWGPCDGLCSQDADLDGNVGVTDFLTVLSNWG